MAYVDNNTANRTPAIIGVAAIHAALAVVIVTGLAGGIVETMKDKGLSGFDIPLPKDIPPPPPMPEPTAQPEKKSSQIVIPENRFDFDRSSNEVEATDKVEDNKATDATLGGTAGVGDGGLGTGGTLTKDMPKLYDPVAPKARNSGWVTDNDYKSVWINREWEGTAGFRLSIGADGKVETCTITDSTGHAALDDATCALVKRRAKFDAAKDDQGRSVRGTFSSAVRWQIPE